MKLERVDIFGFKSFGEKVELTFHEGVTAIVGPNGCGKSNIADAIGWVLGEQSAKSLRGQKMEDVIFNGSQSRAPLALSEVNLRVSRIDLSRDDDETRTHFGKSEVLITRRLDRSGTSEYLIDGAPTRLRDVQELFMGTGVGSKAYAIIEQGKIGLILSSKPTDRRVLIEEAAGITKYKSKRRSAELKLQAAQQNLLRINDIVYEITRQMNSLKRQAGKARRYHRLRGAMERLERCVAVKKSGVLQAKMASTRARLTTVVEEELRRSTSLATAEVFLELCRLRRVEHERELDDTRELLHRLELAAERLDQAIKRDQRQIVELEERGEHIGVEEEELVSRRGPLQERLDQRRREEELLLRELEGREAQTELCERRLKDASLSLAEIEAGIEDARAEIMHRVSKIAAFNNFLQGVLANSEKVAAELLKIGGEQRELEDEEKRLEATAVELENGLRGQQERQAALQREQTTLESEVAKAHDELGSLDNELTREKETLSELLGRLASLREVVQARAHFGSGARLLLTTGLERGIRVLGSVSDALEVDQRLERAAEALFDVALQRVRVENETDVDLARSLFRASPEADRSELLVGTLATNHERGLRATLDALRARSLPGVIGLLSDGVRSSPQDLISFLPDAVVVETFEDALRCFKEVAAPYVSLDGEILAPPGVVILGAGAGGEGLLSTRRQIREMDESITDARARVDDLGGRREQALEELESKRGRLGELHEQRHALEKTLVGLEHETARLTDERRRAERKRAVLASERSRAESESSALQGKRGDMEASLAEEEEAKRTRERAIDELRSQLSARRTGVDELQAEAAEERSRLAALRERRDAVRLDLDRMLEGASELDARIVARRQEREDLVARKSALEEGIAQAEGELLEVSRARREKVDLGQRLESLLAEEISRVKSTEEALKARRRELEAVREQKAAEEVVLAREESDERHLREHFEDSFKLTLVEAAALVTPSELARDDGEMQMELSELKRKLDAIGPVNPMADDEYRELETRHEFVTKQRQDLIDAIESTETAIDRIDRTSKQRFEEAFEAINQGFGETFKQLFGGGGAGIRLVDEDDVLESGIDIIAQPPGKKLQNVLLLSGGEKAMTAIALLFAIFRYRPSPFCLLDEVDAPLDDANVGRFLSMLRELRETTQFIVITHNRKTMEMADQLYGVTMEEPGVSRLVSVSMVEREPAEPVVT
ncbi:MAG TPA: chromosome segregation protein SMC [Vicinamibacteria bacterium]|nr:chromosome segregation protein SMC [Vicinamibacteria bacterium]